MRRLSILVVLFLCLVSVGTALAMSSTNYRVSWQTTSGGGGQTNSANFRLGTAVAQSAGGTCQSSGYVLTGGFWPGVQRTLPVSTVLVDGWNITALSAEPTQGYTASTLAEAIIGQGGSVSQVFWWNAAAGTWDFYLVDTGYGDDCDIELGYGYLLRSTIASTWSYEGARLPAGPGVVPLEGGWNLIALPVDPVTTYTASTMAADINAQGGGVSQVFWWNALAGSWDFYLVNVQYGTDFDIEMGEGYLLKNGTPVTWVIQGN